jgi:hypothetical protein
MFVLAAALVQVDAVARDLAARKCCRFNPDNVIIYVQQRVPGHTYDRESRMFVANPEAPPRVGRGSEGRAHKEGSGRRGGPTHLVRRTAWPRDRMALPCACPLSCVVVRCRVLSCVVVCLPVVGARAPGLCVWDAAHERPLAVVESLCPPPWAPAARGLGLRIAGAGLVGRGRLPAGRPRPHGAARAGQERAGGLC